MTAGKLSSAGTAVVFSVSLVSGTLSGTVVISVGKVVSETVVRVVAGFTVYFGISPLVSEI